MRRRRTVRETARNTRYFAADVARGEFFFSRRFHLSVIAEATDYDAALSCRGAGCAFELVMRPAIQVGMSPMAETTLRVAATT